MSRSKRQQQLLTVTIDDILSDLQCSNKDLLKNRIGIIVDNIEKVKRKQMEQNSLSNFKVLMKRYQIEQRKDEVIQKKSKENQELTSQCKQLSTTICQLNQQMAKFQHQIAHKQMKVRMTESTISKLSENTQTLEKVLQKISQKNQQIEQQNKRLQQQKQYYEYLVIKSRNDLHQKVQTADQLVKMQDQKIKLTTNHQMILQQKLKRALLLKNKERIVQKFRNDKKSQQKDQSVQCQLQENKETRQSFTQIEIEQITLLKLIQQNKNIIEKDLLTTDEIHIYLQSNHKKKKNSFPEISYKGFKKEQQSQTFIEAPKTEKKDSQIQVEILINNEDYLKQINLCVQQMKNKYKQIKQFYEKKLNQMMQKYEQRPARPENILEINELKLKICQLQLEKQKYLRQLNLERQENSRLNEQKKNLQMLSLNKVVSFSPTQTPHQPRNTKLCSKTCNIEDVFMKKKIKTQSGFYNKDRRTWNEEDFVCYNHERKDGDEEGSMTAQIAHFEKSFKYSISKKKRSLNSVVSKDTSKITTFQNRYRKYSEIKRGNLTK